MGFYNDRRLASDRLEAFTGSYSKNNTFIVKLVANTSD
jgi:hypothetical protein